MGRRVNALAASLGIPNRGTSDGASVFSQQARRPAGLASAPSPKRLSRPAATRFLGSRAERLLPLFDREGSVTTHVLRMVEGLVREFQELVLGNLWKRSDAHAHGAPEGTEAGGEDRALDLLPDSLGGDLSPLHIGIRKDEDELFSTVARHEVRAAGALLENAS